MEMTGTCRGYGSGTRTPTSSKRSTRDCARIYEGEREESPGIRMLPLGSSGRTVMSTWLCTPACLPQCCCGAQRGTRAREA
jgi:hypothetical protein